MKIQIRDRLRLSLGRKYLDWAEKLPKFGGGTIATLQRIRRHQREDSETDHNRSRPLPDTSIEFLCFRLFEVFNIETSPSLLRQLLLLFPDLENEAIWGRESFQESFKQQAGQIGGGAYWNLGYIAPENCTRILPGTRRMIKTLPTEVEYISVWLHKILPSMFVITFDVYLNQQATQNLAGVQSKHYS